MKLFGYTRPRDFVSPDFSNSFVAIADRNKIPWMVNENYSHHVRTMTGHELPYYKEVTMRDVDQGGVMISMGGDGTFLEAVRSLKGLPMPIIGINTGRLGFLASIPPENFAQALDDIKRGNYLVRPRSMLAVEGDFDVAPDFPCALNEFTLHRHTADMVEITIWIDGKPTTVVRGDGAIVSTATGSTAYSLSAGGPIVAPDCSCFVVSAIAPHNFSIRPLVVSEDAVIEMEVHTRGREVMASLDNSSHIVGDGARFTIRKSKYSTFFVQPHNISFFDTLRDRIMWGLDKRDKSPNFAR